MGNKTKFGTAILRRYDMRKIILRGKQINRVQAQFDTRSIVFNWKQKIQAQYICNMIIKWKKANPKKKTVHLGNSQNDVKKQEQYFLECHGITI